MHDRPGHLVVSGRWDNNVAIIDVAKALLPENDASDAAIVSRPRVTPDVDTDGDGKPDAPASGQPVSVVADADGRFAYIVNHSGSATPSGADAYQHGHPGLVTVLDLGKACDPASNGNLAAVAAFVSTGRTGPVGCALTPDGAALLVNCGEAAGSEDGGDEITVIDVATRKPTGRVPLKENPAHGAPGPSKHDSPHPSFGRYPNPTGLAISPLNGGTVFVANGGFADVSVFDLRAALAGEAGAEVARVAVETGPFGIACSPDGTLVAVTARESMAEPQEGSTVSIIDVARAAAGGKDAEVARVRVGTDDASLPSRAFGLAFAPDGRHIVVSCFRTNSISIVSVADAVAGRPAELQRLYPTTPSGTLARPRGIAMAGARHACVIGGAKNGPRSSLVWFLDLEKGAIVATATGVGNESYGLAAF
jgi:DNA-binding beta-propeller fold protein YncE